MRTLEGTRFARTLQSLEQAVVSAADAGSIVLMYNKVPFNKI